MEKNIFWKKLCFSTFLMKYDENRLELWFLASGEKNQINLQKVIQKDAEYNFE